MDQVNFFSIDLKLNNSLPALAHMALRIFLFTIAASLSAAHFFRANNFALVVICLLAPLLFLYRTRLSLIVLQLAAYGATLNWVMTIVQLVQLRQQLTRPWAVAAIILVSVALVTLMSGLLLNSRCMRDRYPIS